MSEELPKGWASARLIEVVSARKGKKPEVLREKGAQGWHPYLLIDQMEGKPVRYFTNDPKVTIASKEDVLVVWDGSIGKCTRGLEGAVGSTIVALKPIGIDTSFLEAFIKQSRSILQQTSRGTGLQHINQEVFWDLEVPFAPLAEQRRIVAKLEMLLSKVDACQKRLAKIPVILKRFRQSILAAACSGRLTADWREQNNFREETVNLENLPDGFPALPESWQWVRLESICDKIVDCPHSTPKWTDSGRLCLRTTNFKPGFLDLTEKQYVSDATFEERVVRLLPHPGDVLYSREGGILGVACMIPAGVELCLGQRMMLFRTDLSYTNTLLMHWLNSPVILGRVQYLTGGSASPHLNVKDIKGFPIPIPPLPEQKEIVRLVEALFALANHLDARYTKAKAYVDKLTQSILAKAFRGELVPQDPNDEPASVLLERIRARHDKEKENTTKRRRK